MAAKEAEAQHEGTGHLQTPHDPHPHPAGQSHPSSRGATR
jgi:hypothetical protein